MPLKRFFYSSRRPRRSRSHHGDKNSSSINEPSIVSVARENGACSAKPKPPTSCPIRWKSASSLDSQGSGATPSKSFVKCLLSPKSSKKPQTESPKIRLGPSRSTEMPKNQNSDVDGSPKLMRKKSHSTVRKKFSHFEDLSRLEYCADGYRLNGQQRELIKLCWQQSAEKQGHPGEFIFNWLFSRRPELKKLFGVGQFETASDDPRFQRHTRVFADVLELVVSSVVDEAKESGASSPALSLDDTTGPLLHSYGARHAKIEWDRAGGGDENFFRPEHWDVFRTAMCEYASGAWRQNMLAALSVSSSGQRRNEALHAWSILVHYIVAKVKQGYEMERNELRKRGRGRSITEY